MIQRTFRMTEARIVQRRNNAAMIAKIRRAKEKCKRGHNNWRIRRDGRRYCRTCNTDRDWYRRHGLPFI